uniref:SLAP domain-containing protein n=1 Tax=Companilactobacillus metriopterae TaxID=1909267 RepID=UPI0019D6B917
QKMTIKFNRNEYSALLNDMDQITINGQNFSGGLLTKVWDKVNNTVTVTRQINVTTDNYTDTAIDDVVDTPIVNLSNDTIVTHVYDANGNQIANRALAQGTGWKTDTKRVNNATGQVYYRVATGEYVKAEDVTLRGTSTTTPSTGSELTDITDLTGSHTVSLDTPGFVYPLYTAAGSQAGRNVAGGTSWITDKTAKDAEGNTYYRVATDEWVMAGNGVNFS